MINWPDSIVCNKYLKWYEKLVIKAQTRPLIDGYVERHHIIPVSLGGSNDSANIVTLTAREHYIAHLLLWKMKMTAKMHNQMTMALHVMVNGSGNKKQKRSYLIPSRIYEASRKAYSKLLSEQMQGEGNSFYGKKHTAESIEKMKAWQRDPLVKQQQRERVTGKNNPMYGKTHSDIIKEQIAKSCSVSWTAEKKLEKSKWAKEKWQNPEYRHTMLECRKTSEGCLNRDWKAIGRKAADVRMARGWKPSEESKRKLSKTRKEKLASGEIVPWNKGKKCDHLSGENSSNWTIYRITDPAGNVFVIRTRKKVMEFCKEKNIGYWSLIDLANGKQGKNRLYQAGWAATRNSNKG